MSILATHTNNIGAYSLYEHYTKNTASNDAAAGAAAKQALGCSAPSGAPSGGIFSTGGREALHNALAAMKEAGHTRFTFSDVEEYRQKLESEFSTTVKADLTKLGLPSDAQFSLVLDANGALQVLADGESKALISKYFSDNPEMAQKFKDIQALSNLRKAQQRSPALAAEHARNTVKSYQIEALQSFFAQTDNNGSDYFSQIAAFGSNEASYYLGLNQTV